MLAVCPFCSSGTLLMCVCQTFKISQTKTFSAFRAKKTDLILVPCPRTLHQGRCLLESFKGTAAEQCMSTYTCARGIYTLWEMIVDQKCCERLTGGMLPLLALHGTTTLQYHNS